MELSIFTNEELGTSIKDRLRSHLDMLPEPERLQQVLALLDAATEMDECLDEIIWEAWDYLKSHQLWQGKYPTLKAFQDAIGYEEVMKAHIEKHETLEARKLRESRAIQRNWGKLTHECLPAHLCPPKFSEHLLRTLRQLSQTCSLGQAIALLDSEVSRRQIKSGKGWGASVEQFVLRRDIREVQNQLRLLGHEHLM